MSAGTMASSVTKRTADASADWSEVMTLKAPLPAVALVDTRCTAPPTAS